MKIKIDTEKLMRSMSRGALKTLDMLEAASKKLDPLMNVPLLGGYVEDVQDIISMFNDYSRRRYKKLPVSALVGGAAIIAYLLLPFDIIPDNIPILGFVDDAFIINTILDLCLDAELERYRAWRDGQE